MARSRLRPGRLSARLARSSGRRGRRRRLRRTEPQGIPLRSLAPGSRVGGSDDPGVFLGKVSVAWAGRRQPEPGGPSAMQRVHIRLSARQLRVHRDECCGSRARGPPPSRGAGPTSRVAAGPTSAQKPPRPSAVGHCSGRSGGHSLNYPRVVARDESGRLSVVTTTLEIFWLVADLQLDLRAARCRLGHWRRRHERWIGAIAHVFPLSRRRRAGARRRS